MTGLILVASFALLLPAVPRVTAAPAPEACTPGSSGTTVPATATCSAKQVERTEEELLKLQGVELLQMAFAGSAAESQNSQPAHAIDMDAVGSTQRQIPGIGSLGGLVNNVVDSVVNSNAVNATLQATAEALANQITTALNSTLQNILTGVDNLLATVVAESNLLVESVQNAATNSWMTFVTEVNKTLMTDLAAWQSIPWTSITTVNTTLSTLGLKGIIPPEFFQAFLEAESFAQTIENATVLVNTLATLPQNLSAQPLAQLNATLESGLQQVIGFKNSIVTSFANLMQSASAQIAATLPSAPAPLIAGVNQSLGILQGTVASLGDKVYNAADALVSGIAQATTLAVAAPASAPAPTQPSAARVVAPGSICVALGALLAMRAAGGHC